MEASSYTSFVPTLAFGFVIVVGLFLAANRLGLETNTVTATVADKHYTASGKTYHTTVVAGKSHIQSAEHADAYVLSLTLEGSSALAFVDKSTFDEFDVGDGVKVDARRTRITGQLLVSNVSKR